MYTTPGQSSSECRDCVWLFFRSGKNTWVKHAQTAGNHPFLSLLVDPKGEGFASAAWTWAGREKSPSLQWRCVWQLEGWGGGCSLSEKVPSFSILFELGLPGKPTSPTRKMYLVTHKITCRPSLFLVEGWGRGELFLALRWLDYLWASYEGPA
jgi:hypothetical protein